MTGALPKPNGLFAAQLRRELIGALRSPAEAVNPLVFLFLAITLFALGVGGDPETLSEYAPAIVWVLVLLANLLSLEAMFRRDFEDGTLEQMVLMARPLFVPVLAKVGAQWCVSGLAMTLLAPLVAQLLYVPGELLGTVMLTLLTGSPAITLIGAVGAALTVGLRRGGVLLSLLVLPLFVPVLIFATDAVHTASVGIPTTAQISILAAMLVGSLVLAPPATAASLRISLS